MSELNKYKNALIFTSEKDLVNNDLYQSEVTEIAVDKTMFHSIWPSLYPKKELTNKIGSACGIEFSNSVRMKTVYGDEIINPDGSKIIKPAGVRCYKQGKKMRPDGSYHMSSPCVYEFNWEDRAEIDFITAKEKKDTKYDTALSKRKHVLELKKFASQRASTGAELAVIRELTGMPTGFKENDIAKGTMVFSRICEAKELQALKAAATIDNIRNGGNIANNISESANLLTGSDNENFKETFTRPEEVKNVTPDSPKKDDVQTVQNEMELYLENVSPEARSHFGNVAKEQNYSDQVCQWVIDELIKL